MLYNYQDYILDNVQHLLNIGCKDIAVITDKKFSKHFKNFNIPIEYPENYDDKYLKNANEYIKNKNSFRNGYWHFTSYRFTILYLYMKKKNIGNILHLENDVLLYENPDNIKWHDKSKILITMDTYGICTPGIMYIPNPDILKKLIDNFSVYYKGALSDMASIGKCYHEMDILDTLPLFINEGEYMKNKGTDFIVKNYKKYNYIFDARAIGQFLGGKDFVHRVHQKYKPYINKDCKIHYYKYKFIWKKIAEVERPFIIINNKEYRIMNLHIHCKKLSRFTKNTISN